MTTTSTQDEELAKFGRLADRWWDPAGEMRPLHDINPLRLRYVDERAALQDAKVADIGCGAGILSEAMAQRGASVTGIDLSQPLIDAATAHAAESGVRVDYRCTDSRTLAAEQRDRFDIITCMELLEHTDDPAAIVADCARLVRPGGAVFFSTINRNRKAWLLAIAGAEYLLSLLPRGTHAYDKLIKPAELAAWARADGLIVRSVDGMRYNPLLHRARLEARPQVNYFMHTTRPRQ